jgi:general secretion pathway protein I
MRRPLLAKRPGGRVRSEADGPAHVARAPCLRRDRLPDGPAPPPWNCHRRGITLFEVMLALAIFLGAFAAIGQIIDLGRQASVEGQLENEAVLRAQTKLAEVVAGIEPMTALEGQAFEDDPNWTWGLTMDTAPHVDVLGLTITVEHTRPNGTVDAAFVLTRFVRDPQLFIDAAANASLSEGL